MRWHLISICLLCIAWFPAAHIGMYDPHWSYELAIKPFFPLSVALPIAIGRGATIAIPFAATYFCFNLDRYSTENYGGFLLWIAYAITAFVDLAGITLLFSPQITSALVR